MTGLDGDAIVIGAGPAGSATAIELAAAGWHVVLVERSQFPRQKVCGECLSAASLGWLARLGLAEELAPLLGPPLERIAWWSGSDRVAARMPRAPRVAGHGYGHALGRDRLDAMLLARARAVGVEVLQPVRVRRVTGGPGDFECTLESDPARSTSRALRSRIVVDAHGSWEPLDMDLAGGVPAVARASSRAATRKPAHARSRPARELLAFKASFRGARLPRGLLPLLAFDGGYAGVVVAEEGRLTLACCIAREALRACREALPGASAGLAVEQMLRRHFPPLVAALEGSTREGPWHAVGPLRTGVRIDARAGAGVLCVGNAAGESQPLVGEGIGMALHSAALLATRLVELGPAQFRADAAADLQRAYAHDWRRAFTRRMAVAAAAARIAMDVRLARAAGAVLRHAPRLLTLAARAAGKARAPVRAPGLHPSGRLRAASRSISEELATCGAPHRFAATPRRATPPEIMP